MLATLSLALGLVQSPEGMLATGKIITPIGTHVEVGSYPSNMLALPDGRHAAVSTMGFNQALAIVRIADGALVGSLAIPRSGSPIQGLYYGLAADPASGVLYASRGAMDQVSRYRVSRLGEISSAGDPITNRAPAGSYRPLHPAGLALTSDGRRLVVANNQTTHTTDYKGSVSVINTVTGSEEARIPVGGFPYGVVLLTKGRRADSIAYAASERDNRVDVVDISARRVARTIKTGAAPGALILNSTQTRLYTANAHGDSVTVISTETDRVMDTIMLRPTELPGLPGATPQGLALSPDEKTLYAALSDMNAIAVVDLERRALKGYLPTGWLPTSVIATRTSLLVACAKGVKAQNPNGKPVGDRGTYIQDIIAGTVSRIPLPEDQELREMTRRVILNNRLRRGLGSSRLKGFDNPGITHVIYVVKENRTYDNVLADLPQGNGDPSLCLFPRKVTPNQHALAERFVLLDNFHVCAEVSQDGWVWSTAGMVNAYGSRNTPYNYSGRGRSYDTEGSNNGVPVDLIDLPDVSRPPGGYIWELCKKHGISYRNYGFFTQFIDALDKRYDVLSTTKDNAPAKKALQGMTNEDFRRYDLAYADSEIYKLYDWSWSRQRKTFGRYNSPSRYSEWKREFDEFVRKGSMPRFQMIRFGQDHTSGTAAGQPTPESMVADNDYAVGQLVEAVSTSPFWKTTLICILEDDAQAGIDHVDAHRSTAYLVSPYIKPGTIDSRFYNTSSMLRTMELVLGLPPMNQYDAVAEPINVFSRELVNDKPFSALMIDKEIVCAENAPRAYRQDDSNLISFYIEESLRDEDLNDILWVAVKGKSAKRPPTRTRLMRFEADDD